MTVQPGQFETRSLRQSPRGDDICHILASSLHSADARMAVHRHVSMDGERLIISGRDYDLHEYQHVYIVGAGKAAVPMAVTLGEILGGWLTAGLVITKKGYRGNERVQQTILVYEADHPIPQQSNLDASQKLTSLIGTLNRADLVFCLLSGGGSALLTRPAPGISLNDLQNITRLLLACGAEIHEINTIRKHLEELKGGGVAKLVYPATMISLIISDVIGDNLESIASGPTAADPTTYQDALDILTKYQLIDQLSSTVRSHFQDGVEGKLAETLKPGDPIFTNVHNIIIGNNTDTVLAAQQYATDQRFNTRVLPTPLFGEASQVGRSLAKTAKRMLASGELSRPACLVAGGETTVTIHGTGMGGRNQELTLGAVEGLSGDEQFILVSLATDGGDGPTDAAGAVATNQTYAEGSSMGLNPSEYLKNNDSYHYFERLGDLITTGPTLTNVNDLVFIFSW